MNRIHASLLAIVLLPLATAAAAAPPAHSPGLRGAEAMGVSHVVRQKDAGMTLEQAVDQVRVETGGRILAAETVEVKGRRVHRIKVLTPDHRVRVVEVEAGNGRR